MRRGTQGRGTQGRGTRRRGTRRRVFVENTAGIVLVNENYDKVLMITTPDGYLGFPKGHIEPRDRGNLLTTAIRETYEETGIKVKKSQIVKGFRKVVSIKLNRKKSQGHDRPSGRIRKDIYLYLAIIPETTRVKIQKEEVGSYAWVSLKGIERTLRMNLMHKHSLKRKRTLNNMPHITLRRRNRAFTDVAKSVSKFLRIHYR